MIFSIDFICFVLIIETQFFQTNTLENTLVTKIKRQLYDLKDIFDEGVHNQTALAILLSAVDIVDTNVSLTINAVSDIRRPLMGITMSNFLNVTFYKKLLNISLKIIYIFLER